MGAKAENDGDKCVNVVILTLKIVAPQPKSCLFAELKTNEREYGFFCRPSNEGCSR